MDILSQEEIDNILSSIPSKSAKIAPDTVFRHIKACVVSDDGNDMLCLDNKGDLYSAVVPLKTSAKKCNQALMAKLLKAIAMGI